MPIDSIPTDSLSECSQLEPGPWSFEIDDGAHKIRDANGKTIMCDERYYPWCPDELSSWHLIAAAPDLLKVLKELLASQLATMPPFEAGQVAQDAWADRRAKARNDAAFVISKAEGRS